MMSKWLSDFALKFHKKEEMVKNANLKTSEEHLVNFIYKTEEVVNGDDFNKIAEALNKYNDFSDQKIRTVIASLRKEKEVNSAKEQYSKLSNISRDISSEDVNIKDSPLFIKGNVSKGYMRNIFSSNMATPNDCAVSFKDIVAMCQKKAGYNLTESEYSDLNKWANKNKLNEKTAKKMAESIEQYINLQKIANVGKSISNSNKIQTVRQQVRAGLESFENLKKISPKEEAENLRYVTKEYSKDKDSREDEIKRQVEQEHDTEKKMKKEKSTDRTMGLKLSGLTSWILKRFIKNNVGEEFFNENKKEIDYLANNYVDIFTKIFDKVNEIGDTEDINTIEKYLQTANRVMDDMRNNNEISDVIYNILRRSLIFRHFFSLLSTGGLEITKGTDDTQENKQAKLKITKSSLKLSSNASLIEILGHKKNVKVAEYQGWSNYETWAVALWIDNDRAIYEQAHSQFDELVSSLEATDVWSKEENIQFTFAEYLKGLVEDNNPLSDSSSMYTDLLNAAISEVDYDEIAQNYLDEANIGKEVNTEKKASLNKKAERYSLDELENMETIESSQADDLKYEDDDTRVWLSRMTRADGAPYNNQVTIEKLVDGRWEIVDTYNPSGSSRNASLNKKAEDEEKEEYPYKLSPSDWEMKGTPKGFGKEVTPEVSGEGKKLVDRFADKIDEVVDSMETVGEEIKTLQKEITKIKTEKEAPLKKELDENIAKLGKVIDRMGDFNELIKIEHKGWFIGLVASYAKEDKPNELDYIKQKMQETDLEGLLTKWTEEWKQIEPKITGVKEKLVKRFVKKSSMLVLSKDDSNVIADLSDILDDINTLMDMMEEQFEDIKVEFGEDVSYEQEEYEYDEEALPAAAKLKNNNQTKTAVNGNPNDVDKCRDCTYYNSGNGTAYYKCAECIHAYSEQELDEMKDDINELSDYFNDRGVTEVADTASGYSKKHASINNKEALMGGIEDETYQNIEKLLNEYGIEPKEFEDYKDFENRLKEITRKDKVQSKQALLDLLPEEDNVK